MQRMTAVNPGNKNNTGCTQQHRVQDRVCMFNPLDRQRGGCRLVSFLFVFMAHGRPL